MQKLPIRPTKRQALVDAIIANEAKHGTASYLTVPELANAQSCTPELVYRYRAYLKAKGLIKIKDVTESMRHVMRNKQGRATRPMTPSEALAAIADEPIPNELQRLRQMAYLLRVGSPQVKIAAFKALEEASRGRGERVGPPAPLTEEEAVARLCRLMLAVGESISTRAYDAAFKEPQARELKETLQSDDGRVRGIDLESTLPLPDLPPTEPPSDRPQPLDGQD